MNSLNRSGDLYLTHTKLDGKFTLRFCVGQTNTEPATRGACLEENSGGSGEALMDVKDALGKTCRGCTCAYPRSDTLQGVVAVFVKQPANAQCADPLNPLATPRFHRRIGSESNLLRHHAK